MAHPDPSTDTQPEHVPHVRAVLDQLDSYSFAFSKAGSHQLARHLQELKIIISTQRWEMINIRLQLEAEQDEQEELRLECDELLGIMREVADTLILACDNPGVDCTVLLPKVKMALRGDTCLTCFGIPAEIFGEECADCLEVVECGEPGYLVAWKPCHLPKGHPGGCEHRVVSDPYACDCSDPACGLHPCGEPGPTDSDDEWSPCHLPKWHPGGCMHNAASGSGGTLETMYPSRWKRGELDPGFVHAVHGLLDGGK